MAVNEEYLEYLKDQLSGIGDFEAKKMFGGVGFFKEGLMFGLYGKEFFHLKVDDSNRSQYESLGKTAFMSSAKKKGMPYYKVPVEVLEDKSELAKWALQSFEIALKAKK